MSKRFYSMVKSHRNKIWDIYYDENGEKHIKKINFKPTIGYKVNDETDFTSLHDEHIQIKDFDSINEWKEYVYENKSFIELFGNIDPQYQYINQNYKDIEFDYKKMKVFLIDIEVVSDGGFPKPSEAKYPINSLAIKDKHKNIYFVLSLKPYDKTKTILDIDPKNIKFKQCESEEDLLKTLIMILKNEKPDFLVGYYSDGFDFPYIINRCYNILSDKDVKDMSMFKIVKTVESEYQGRTMFKSTIGGITLLDFLDLYKKYTFKPRSFYTLDHISSVELKENKINHEVYDNFYEFWKNDPQLWIDYNITDVELIDKLDDHLGLINLHCQLSYKARCNFEDALGTVKIWDILIYNYLIDQNIMIPPLVIKESEKFAGAHVKDPVKKIYDWILSIDLNSLYPHLIMQYNISPETLIDGKCIPELLSKKLDERLLRQEISSDPRAILAANGQYFSKEKIGFLPKLMAEIYNERKTVKKKMLKEKQDLVYIKEEMKKRKLKT